MTEQAAAAQAVVDAVGQITFGPESTFENLSIVARCSVTRSGTQTT
jgi:hypothetical protein